MRTLEKQKEQKTRLCCPKFHPEKWDKKTFYWIQKPFIKEMVPEFFHIPYPPMIAKKVNKMVQLAQNAGRLSENREDILLLFMDPNPFRSELHLSVTGNVPGAHNTTLSGTFMSKVYDGEYKAIPGFIKQMNDFLREQDKQANNYYVHYAYCPMCAEREGHNYMVLFAEIKT